jgi:hypothetical protein
MDADMLAEMALAEAMSADIEIEKVLAESMAKDWEDLTKSISGGGGATSSVSGFGVAIAAVALVAAPVLGVLGAGAADLVIGIKNANVETGGLKSAWHDLEAEAGNSMQGGLQTAVDGLTKALPQLDPLVNTLSTDIGNALGDLGTWLGNGGATKIVNYLQTEIPIVGHAFEALGSAIGGFISVTQGPANFLLETFTAIFNIISKIESIGGAITSLGPGGTTGGFGGTTSPNGSTFGSQAQHAINTNSPYQFGSAPTSGDTASDAVHDIVKFISNPFSGLEGGTDGGAAKNKAAAQSKAQAQQQFATQFAANQSQLQKATAGLDDNTTAAQANAKAFGQTVAVYENAQATAAQFAAQTAQNTANMQAENNAAGILQQALSGLGGNVLGVDQANTQFYASINAVNASLKQTGTSLDITTAKGEANRQAIEASIAAAQQHAQAIATETGSTVQATQTYNEDIAALKAHLAATGMSKQAIDQYVDSIDAIKPLVETQIDVNAAAAQAVIDSLNRQLSTLGKTATGIEVTSEAVLRRAAAADGLFLQFYADGGMENHVAQMAPAGTMRVWAEPETGGESYIPHAESKRSRSEAILSQTANLFGGMYIPRTARSFADGMVLRGTGAGMPGGVGGQMPEIHNHNVLQIGRREIPLLTKAVNEQNQWNNRLGR